MAKRKTAVPALRVEYKILLIRGFNVMLDSDPATLYGVTTKRLNEQVQRNIGRFPEDFMFQLTKEEKQILKSQIATSSANWGGRRTPPYAFTEHRAIMLAGVLNSQQAVDASIFVVRAFVRLREILSTHKEISKNLAALDRKVAGHDGNIKAILAAIRRLMKPPPSKTKRIGFDSKK